MREESIQRFEFLRTSQRTNYTKNSGSIYFKNHKAVQVSFSTSFSFFSFSDTKLSEDH